LLFTNLLQQAGSPPVIDNTNWFLAVITAVLAAITWYYARQTKNSVIALEESTKAQFKPFLSASLAMVGPVALDLMIANIGKGSAEDVRITFRVLEFQNTEREWNQELILPEAHQKFFIPTGERQAQHNTQFFETNQTTLVVDWECRDILGILHSGRKQIDVTAFVRQMNRTQARFEEPFEDRMSRDIGEISTNARRMSDTLGDIRREIQRLNTEEQP
jgi:hypothetical protein